VKFPAWVRVSGHCWRLLLAANQSTAFGDCGQSTMGGCGGLRSATAGGDCGRSLRAAAAVTVGGDGCGRE
jgi:hypothetical protein